jgi:hypothetical protein
MESMLQGAGSLFIDMRGGEDPGLPALPGFPDREPVLQNWLEVKAFLASEGIPTNFFQLRPDLALREVVWP